MHTRILSTKSGVPLKFVIGDIFIIVNLVIWYNYASAILRDAIDEVCFIFFEKLLLYIILFMSSVVSILAGTILVTKLIERKRVLLVWSLIGVFSSLTFAILETATMFNVLLFLLPLVGLSFGLGLPVCMAIFADITSEENRARFGAIVILLTFLGMFFFGFIMATNLFWNTFVLAVWRSLAIISVLVLGPSLENKKQKKSPSIFSLLKDRSVLLYLVPWSVFSMVNYLGWPVNSKIHGESFVYFSVLVSNIVAGISAVIAGFAADKIGRKRTLLVGFTIFGIGYAVLGISPFNIYAWYLYTLIDGVAWGILFVIFVFTIWGDLARENQARNIMQLAFYPTHFPVFCE